MRQYFKINLILFIFILLSNSYTVFSQCLPVPVVDAVINGNFDNGYEGFTIAEGGYTKNVPGQYSNPGTYMVHSNEWKGPNNTTVSSFNAEEFKGIYDHTRPGVRGNMLMIDAKNVVTVSWQLDNLPVFSNQTYFFSAWVTSLYNANLAQLQFEIKTENSATWTKLGNQFEAPAKGVWKQIFQDWPSGASTKVSIRIVDYQTNQVPGNDFALDDISFMNGCDATSTGPDPDLGGSLSLCNSGGKITLDSKIPSGAGIKYEWIKIPDATLIGTSKTLEVTTPGTYKVCVTQGAGCAKSSMVEITNLLKVDLGPDVTLCNPPTVTLNTKLNDPTLSYVWYKDANILTNEKGPTLNVGSSGTYKVTVSSKVTGCETVSDEIKIDTKTATPVEGTFCSGKATFSVTGNGQYAWYDKPTGGVKKGGGKSISVPMTEFDASKDEITYYAEDTTLVYYKSGAPIATNPKNYSTGGANNSLLFEVIKEMNLDTVSIESIFYYSGKSKRGRISVISPDGTVIKSVIATVPNPGILSQNTVKVPVYIGARLTPGAGYQLLLEKEPDANYEELNAGYFDNGTFPYTVPGILSINQRGQYDKNYYFYFDWKISVPPGCGRVPVTLKRKCPLCSAPSEFVLKATAKELCASTTTSSIGLSVETIIPAASVDGSPFLYQWYKNDLLMGGENKSSLTVTNNSILGNGTYHVRVGHTSVADGSGCYLDSSVQLTFESPIIKNKITQSDTICLGGKIPILDKGSVPSGGKALKYAWESSASVNGTYTNIVGANLPTYNPSNITASTFFRRVVSSSGICPKNISDTASIVIASSISGNEIEAAPAEICQYGVPVLKGKTAVSGGNGTFSYSWEVDSSLSATSDWKIINSANSSDLLSTFKLSKIGTYKFKRTVISGKCNLSSETEVKTIPGMDPGTISSNQEICADTIPKALTSLTSASGGTGPAPKSYTYKWQSSTDGIVFIDIPGTTGQLNYAPTSLSKTTYFAREATSVGGSTACDVGKSVVKVVVLEKLNPGSIVQDTGICSGNSVILNSKAAYSGGSLIKSYQWQSSGTGGAPWVNLPASSSEKLQIDKLNSTAFFQRITEDKKCGTVNSNVAKVSVQLLKSPRITKILPNVPMCELDKNVLFKADTTGAGNNGKFEWYLNDIKQNSNGSDSIRLSDWKAPVSQVRVKIISDRSTYACYAKDHDSTINLPITQKITPTVTLNKIDPSCEGKELSFTATPSPVSSKDKLVWKVDGIEMKSFENKMTFKTATLINGQSISVEFTSGSNCATTPNAIPAKKLLTIYEYPVASTDPIVPTTICFDSKFTINADAALNSNAEIDYKWLKNGEPIKNAFNPNYTTKEAGLYQVLITNGGICSDTSNGVPLRVEKVDVDAGKDLEMDLDGPALTLNGSLLLNDEKVTDLIDYTIAWKSTPSDPSFRINSEQLSPSVSPLVPTIYTVTATSAAGCKDSADVKVTVYLPITIPNVFSPNGDGLNDDWHIEGLYSYPNAIVKVYNRWGNVVFESVGYPSEGGNNWNGTSNGVPLPVATYYYVIDRQASNKKPISGYVVIIR